MGGFWSLATCHWDWSWWKYDVQVMAFSAGSICCCVIEVVLANRIWAINKTQRVPGAWCGFLLSKTNPITFFYTLQNIIVFGCRLEIYGKVSTSQLKYRLTYKIRLFFRKGNYWDILTKNIYNIKQNYRPSGTELLIFPGHRLMRCLNNIVL